MAIQKKKKAIARTRPAVEPLADRVLVRPTRQEEKKIGALIIPTTGGHEKPDTGVIIAVGQGRFEDGKLIPLRVQKGDKVVFSKYGYDEVKVQGEDLYILKEDSILAIIND